MSSHARQFADLYDVFYGDKNYSAEAEFVHRVLTRDAQGGASAVLELACGTGLHSIALARLGHRIVATDYSEDMLRRARANVLAAGVEGVEFLQQDMRTLNAGGRLFDAAFCLFDSIGYVKTNDAVLSVMRNVHRHLRDGGLFLFEFWHAGAFLRRYDPVRFRRWKTPSGDVLRVSETTLDLVAQTADVSYTVFAPQADGRYVETREIHTCRYFLVQEMAAHLSAAGFQPERWFAGFSTTDAIADDTWHVIALARKAG